MSTTNTVKAMPVARGCGQRVMGGLYVECGLSPSGAPLEAFLIDPPSLIDIQALGITPVGTKLIDHAGAFHVIDWVGSSHYENVCDFVEEVRRFGLSRRIACNTDFTRLTSASRILLLHSRAYVENFAEYAKQWEYSQSPKPGHPQPRCPKNIAAHDQNEPPAMCAGVYWQDIDGGVSESSSPRTVTRTLPSFSYTACARPTGINPKYLPAVFASFPISRLVAVRGSAEENSRNKKLLSKSTLPGEFEDR